MWSKSRLVRVGKYQFGPEFTTLFLSPGRDGAWFPCGIDGVDEPCMVLGADHDEWSGVFDSMVHECLEASMVRLGCHFKPTAIATQDISAVIMVANHAQISEIASRTAMFVSTASIDANKAWGKWKRNGKR